MHWLAEVGRQLALEDSLLQAMHDQLAPEFERRVGEGLGRFRFVPPLEVPPTAQSFRVEREGDTVLLHGDMENLDFGSPAVIAWHPAPDGSVFEWRELRAEEIRAFLVARRAPFAGLAERHGAEIRDPVWPHLRLTFLTAAEAKPAQIEVALALDPARQDPRGGFVHRVGPVHALGSGRFAVEVDFGSAPLETLEDAIARVAARVPLSGVLVDSRPDWEPAS